MSANTEPATRAGLPLEDLDRAAERFYSARTHCSESAARRLRDEMIRTALPMADRLARRYRVGREPSEDVRQAARLGLVKAVERYDPARGSFTAYAVICVTGEIKRHFRDHTWTVHVPRRLQELALTVHQADQELAAELRRRPTEEEVAGRCGVDRSDLAAARLSGAGYRGVSLHQPIGSDGAELLDLFGDLDAAVDRIADEVTVAGLLGRLPARERRILAMRFQGEHTQTEIAAALGLSQMHVSRLLSRTLGWLRAALLSDTVPPWPGSPEPEDDGRVRVTVEPGDGRPVRLHVHGEVDRDNAGRLREPVLAVVRQAAPGTRMVLDLGGVPLLDAAGIGVLIAVHEAARVRGVTVTATGLQPYVRRVARIAGLQAMLEG
ncbi:sigma-70 family RNA polymerase sigma factor [Actinoplanes sp. NPDC023714]|uniref:sigma-70 family RNA polymerase sigma factor n=1 Tax=Actinoplanes sp. NPDC023714 TaxID=3154322 RepID=UPI0033DBD641